MSAKPANLPRQCRTIARQSPVLLTHEGRELVDFSSNDYLGLALHPKLAEAAAEAAKTHGTGASASRLITGTSPQVAALEAALAAWKGTEAALVFNSGYQANVGILQALVGRHDWIIADKLNHASLVDGCKLTGATLKRYRHLDLAHAEQLLQQAPASATKWLVTDSVFSMDGDYPDLEALVNLAEAYGAKTIIDEAHATGVFGEGGRGLCDHYQITGRTTVQMGTFSKALGSFGAFVACSEALKQHLVNHARSFIYSTALPPSVISVNHAAIDLVQKDSSFQKRLQANAAYFYEKLQQQGFFSDQPVRYASPIVPIIIGEEAKTLAASESLAEQGLLVWGIRPPTVPAGTSRLRVSVSAAHSRAQMDDLILALKNIL